MKNVCRKSLFFIVSLYISAAQADNYLLTMSKNDDICQHLYQIFNMDLRHKGKLVLDEHKEFNWLEWDKEFFMVMHKRNIEPNFSDELRYKSGTREEYATYSKYFRKGTFFDIDNDGKDEFVSFERRGPHTGENLAYDNLFIHKGDSFKNLPGAEIRRFSTPEMGFLGLFTKVFTLKEYPVKKKVVNKNGYINRSWPLIATSYIRPFLFNKTYYIALFGNVETHIYDYKVGLNQTIDDKNAIAVVQFTPSYNAEKINHESRLRGMGQPSNQTLDICYFVKMQVIKQGDK